MYALFQMYINYFLVVCFDPKLYLVTEGDDVTLTLVTNSTVAKNFSVMVTTVDGTATGKYMGTLSVCMMV